MKKKILIYCIFCVVFIFCTLTLFAKTSYVFDEHYSAEIAFSDCIVPGDPVFIKITLNARPTHKLKFSSVLFDGSASIVPVGGKKEQAKSNFYMLTQSKNQAKYFLLLPLSSFISQSEYIITLQGNLTLETVKSKIMERDFFAKLTVPLQKKDFVSETIPLDSKNTTIRTDASPARAKQIERLNEILQEVNYDAVSHNFAQFIRPIDTERKTSYFADRRVFAYSNGGSATSLHYGIDYGAPTGTPVFAPAKGKVVLAESRVTTGYSVVIEHYPGLYSLYYHFDKYIVEEGQMVEQGQNIGFVGSTGLATGPHLHWEVRLLTQAVNPEWFIENTLALE